MTLLQRYIAQCVKWCEAGQKAHAWHLAQEAGTLYPAELSDLPELLTAEMKARQRSSLQVIEGGKNESSTHRR